MKTAPQTQQTTVSEADTAASAVMTQEEFDDSFDDIIHGGFEEDDGHRGGETCWPPIGECDQTPKFWLALPDDTKPDGRIKQFFCPRHFALRLHLILDATRRNVFFDEQATPAQIREVFQSYFLDWGRIGL